MHDTIGELCTREIINLCDGQRLGYARDCTVNLENGRIRALLVPEHQNSIRIFGKTDDIQIPWETVKKIGPEMILVEIPGEYQLEKRKNRFFGSWKKD